MKNSKKKFWVSMAGIGLSVSLLSATAFAAADNLTGYNKIKEYVMDAALNPDTLRSENSTTTSSTTFKRNQEEIASLGVVNKYQKDGDTYFSNTKSTFTSGNDTIIEDFWQESSYTRDVDVKKGSEDEKYYVNIWDIDIEGVTGYKSIPGYGDDSNDPAQKKLVNALMDLVSGDTKNQFRMEGNTVSLNLQGAQIPEIAQLALGVLEERIKKDTYVPNHMDNEQCFYKSIRDSVLDLRDLRLEGIIGEIEYAGMGDQPLNLKIELDITGVDANGVKHDLEIDLTMEESDLGTTTADRINLDDIRENAEIYEQNFDEIDPYESVIIEVNEE